MDIVLWGPLWQPHTLPYPFTKTWVFSWALAWEAEGRSQKGFTTDPEQAVIQGNKNLVSLHLSKLGNFLKGLVPLRNNQGSVLRVTPVLWTVFFPWIPTGLHRITWPSWLLVHSFCISFPASDLVNEGTGCSLLVGAAETPSLEVRGCVKSAP